MRKNEYQEHMLALMEKRVTKDISRKYNMGKDDKVQIEHNVKEYSRRKEHVAQDLNLQIDFLRKMSNNPEAHHNHEPKRMKHPLVEVYTEKAVKFGITKVDVNDVNMATEGYWRRDLLNKHLKKREDQKKFSRAVIFDRYELL